MKGETGLQFLAAFIFEPPGDIHTLISEEVITLFILGGALQYFDENNQITGQDDIYTVMKKYRDYCSCTWIGS